MQKISRQGYSKETVKNALHAVYQPRNIRFKYNLLDKDNNYIRTLSNVLSGEVSCNSNANIKRTAVFRLEDDNSINYLSDRIQPFFEIKMFDGKYISFPLGIFLLSSPTRIEKDNLIIRDIEAYDGLIILKEDKFSERYVIEKGTNYIDAVKNILTSAGITKWNIDYTDKKIDKRIEFEPGKEKLFAINQLLRQINYNGIKVDVNGYYTSSYYRSPSQRSAEYTYIDDKISVTLPGMEEELDLVAVPNQFVVVRTNGEQEPLRSSYTNDSIDSPTSTVNRGRVITDHREINDIADQEALNGYVRRIANESSQIYGKIKFETALMPMHDIDDVINIEYSKLGVKAKYAETSWKLPLKTGGRMVHQLRRVIDI
ncbi:hypothetical protein SAMN05216389_12116 [Oceanobacillus limi]|uniref:Virus ReqiPepy6 Gp37-like protein n=1 Tax=Oceanobacillus limi TaxID=930131 RepID=A0A1I0GGR6_9BACI|nr:hypothetical protein [Oceanobacillus limi]SET69318.1 hypothetical protein SAMN05216389_12116 [Oceanobacillus limi]